ncbi:MAG: GerMN domain-containing protein [Eubacteriales bacterium]|nr:GerMN domain-containing protein [Eubacteriales bacterium]
MAYGRRLSRLLLCLALCLCALTAAGCARQKKEETAEATFSVYYINKEETRITAVEKALAGQTAKEQVRAALEALAENPVELSLRSPLGGFSVSDWSVKEAQLLLDVSTDYKKLSATTEVLVRAAIVRTMTQIPGIDSVSMTVGGEALTDSLGLVVGPMTADWFIDNAGNEINAYEKARLKLYFANSSGDRLVEVTTRPVVYSSNISMERLVVEQLIAGPGTENEEVYPVLNAQTEVLGVTVKDGTCYVNLNSAFLTPAANVTAQVEIYAIVNSLVELPNVNKVQISVEGKTDVTFRESISLSQVFDRNLDLVYGTEE